MFFAWASLHSPSCTGVQEDLVSALVASCHIPVYANGSFFVRHRGRLYVDGGLTAFIPSPPGLHTVKVWRQGAGRPARRSTVWLEEQRSWLLLHLCPLPSFTCAPAPVAAGVLLPCGRPHRPRAPACQCEGGGQKRLEHAGLQQPAPAAVRAWHACGYGGGPGCRPLLLVLNLPLPPHPQLPRLQESERIASFLDVAISPDNFEAFTPSYQQIVGAV